MIISTIRINAAPARKKEILEILFSVKGPTEGQPGCLSSNIYQNLLANHLITYVEVWKTKAGLFKHIRSPLYRSILAAIDMSCELPDIQFSSVSETDGMELIKAALRNADAENKIWDCMSGDGWNKSTGKELTIISRYSDGRLIIYYPAVGCLIFSF